MIIFMIPKTKKDAAIYSIVISALFAVLLFIEGFDYAKGLIIRTTWTKTEATVTDFHDGPDGWTEYMYSVDGQKTVVKEKGHSYWDKIGSAVQIVYSPKNPHLIKKENEIMSSVKTMGFVCLVAGAVWAFYFLTYLYYWHKEKQQAN